MKKNLYELEIEYRKLLSTLLYMFSIFAGALIALLAYTIAL